MSENEFMKHVRKEFIELVKKNKIVTKDILPERMNSYEWNYLMEFWDNKLLIENAKYYILQSFCEFRKNSFREIDGCYNEALKHKLIHMLIERLEILIKEKEIIICHRCNKDCKGNQREFLIYFFCKKCYNKLEKIFNKK